MDLATDATRARLCDWNVLSAVRAAAPVGMKCRCDAELESSLELVLRAHDQAADLHVFGYGSLMWNPALDYTRAEPARVHGWHRRFCLRTLVGRGSESEPGLMLALDRGGACN